MPPRTAGVVAAALAWRLCVEGTPAPPWADRSSIPSACKPQVLVPEMGRCLFDDQCSTGFCCPYYRSCLGPDGLQMAQVQDMGDTDRMAMVWGEGGARGSTGGVQHRTSENGGTDVCNRDNAASQDIGRCGMYSSSSQSNIVALQDSGTWIKAFDLTHPQCECDAAFQSLYLSNGWTGTFVNGQFKNYCDPDYIKSDTGASNCPAGFIRIMDLQECKAAIAYLGLGDTTSYLNGRHGAGAFPGCVNNAGNDMVAFNQDNAGLSDETDFKLSDVEQYVCKKSGAPPAPSPTPSPPSPPAPGPEPTQPTDGDVYAPAPPPQTGGGGGPGEVSKVKGQFRLTGSSWIMSDFAELKGVVAEALANVCGVWPGSVSVDLMSTTRRLEAARQLQSGASSVNAYYAIVVPSGDRPADVVKALSDEYRLADALTSGGSWGFVVDDVHSPMVEPAGTIQDYDFTCPNQIKDLLSHDMWGYHFEMTCEGGVPHFAAEGPMHTVYGSWGAYCDHPWNTSLEILTYRTGLYKECQTTADCPEIGCGCSCQMGMCVPAAPYEHICQSRITLDAHPGLVELACAPPPDPRESECMYIKTGWDAIGCMVFEDDEHFEVTHSAAMIAHQCAGYLKDYDTCIEVKFKSSDREYYERRYPPQHIRKNLYVAMHGEPRCATISKELASELRAVTCPRAH